MQFKYTVKQAITKLLEAKKKKKLKVILDYKKELLPILFLLKKGSLIYKFLVKKGEIHVFLKREKFNHYSQNNHKQKTISLSEVERFVNKHPVGVLIISTDSGVLTPDLYKNTSTNKGGKLLCFFD
jgi:ribosomal protein S8